MTDPPLLHAKLLFIARGCVLVHVMGGASSVPEQEGRGANGPCAIAARYSAQGSGGYK